MKSACRIGIVMVILAVLMQGQAGAAQAKKAGPARVNRPAQKQVVMQDQAGTAQVQKDRPARVKQTAQNQALLPGGGQINRLLNQVMSSDLSPEQAQTLHQLVRRARARADETQKAVQEARKGLMQAVNQGASPQAIRPAAQALTDAFIAQAMFQVRIRNAVQDQLTEEQLKNLHLGKKNTPRKKPAKVQPPAPKVKKKVRLNKKNEAL